MSERSGGVYLTKAQAVERLTELRDQALTTAEHAEPAEHEIEMAKAHCYRLAMGIIHNIREEPF